ncbi:cytochrome c [Ectothiorhodospiraceae bacterium 2226]|nr:cytochrome c [Ectothiorhodospiraceae bacterium 2226]
MITLGWRQVLLALAVFVLLAAGGGVAFIYSGIYDIAATEPHTRPVRWVMQTTMEHSVKRRAANIEAPELGGDALIRRGFVHFRQECVYCHGAPGVAPEDLGLGLWPPAPPLVDAPRKWTSAELFWITKYGIKMTGMPAWRLTEDDEDLWAIVAFLEYMPNLSPRDYQAMEQAVEMDERLGSTPR